MMVLKVIVYTLDLIFNIVIQYNYTFKTNAFFLLKILIILMNYTIL